MATSTTSATNNPSQTLTEADFLNLLVTQMTSQDPLDPQSDTEFAAQLAQFSSLQEAQTMQGNMATIQANSMIGETATLNPPGGGGSVSGVVSGVQIQSGTPDIMVNGQAYDLSTVTGFSPPANSTATTGNNTGSTANAIANLQKTQKTK